MSIDDVVYYILIIVAITGTLVWAVLIPLYLLITGSIIWKIIAITWLVVEFAAIAIVKVNDA